MAGLFALPLDASPQSSGKGSWKLPPRMMSNWEIAADYEVMSLIMNWVVAGKLIRWGSITSAHTFCNLLTSYSGVSREASE